MMVVVIMLCLLWGAAVAKGNGNRTTVNLPDEIAFQVYVAFDNVLHTAFSNEREAQKYAVVFFNAINLIFQNMTNPKIKFEVVLFHGQFLNFTGPALTLESNEVDAHKSLTSIDKFIMDKAQFHPSDILFVFSGRKVFTRGSNNRKEYSPQGLTWEGGICNGSRKIVIVSDIGKHFQALPNAGFQLARLETTCRSTSRKYMTQLTCEIWSHLKTLNASSTAACLTFSRRSISSIAIMLLMGSLAATYTTSGIEETVSLAHVWPRTTLCLSDREPDRRQGRGVRAFQFHVETTS
ncbi:uncharacterized protein LOC135371742 isoform X3 [Ornithodoros turicata]|uniref:uncharacterized protein LOC135371742 isoform X3 n=1 Tax=Ornithodoros turicata TaxID=34597 RepID=UPI0031388699